jgi:hypothetical protein
MTSFRQAVPATECGSLPGSPLARPGRISARYVITYVENTDTASVRREYRQPMKASKTATAGAAAVPRGRLDELAGMPPERVFGELETGREGLSAAEGVPASSPSASRSAYTKPIRSRS